MLFDQPEFADRVRCILSHPSPQRAAELLARLLIYTFGYYDDHAIVVLDTTAREQVLGIPPAG
jgi:hypothetical protein